MAAAAKWYARLGATCYGFYPLQLPPKLPFAELLAALEPSPPTDQQRKQITVLFADIVDSTGMGQGLDPEGSSP